LFWRDAIKSAVIYWPWSVHDMYGYRVRTWGDTCGGVRELAFITFWLPGGCPNRGSALKFGAAYPLVIFFDCEYLEIFFRSFFFLFKNSNDYFQSNLFLRVKKNVLEKISKNSESKIITRE
jgi:hypothetical protein